MMSESIRVTLNNVLLTVLVFLHARYSFSAFVPFDSPCPDIFRYMYDQENYIYGSIQVYRPFDSVIQLNVQISVGNSIQGYNGNIELGYPKPKAIENIMNGRPLLYKLHFPRWMGIPPRITRISVNGNQICTGPPIDLKLVPILTTVNLQHTLRINITPTLTGNVPPDYRFDTSFDSNTQNNFHQTVQSPPRQDDFIRPTVQFNPQPPKDPSKVFPSNPFLNSVTTSNAIIGDQNRDNQNKFDTNPFLTTTPSQITSDNSFSDVPTSTPTIEVRSALSNICGKSVFANTNSLIANGRSAGRGYYPWLTAIYTIKNLGLEFTCGGNLVSTKHVVTAAHCVKQRERKLQVDQVLIILGKYNIQRWSNGDFSEALLVNALEIIPHSDYKPNSADADIAIIVLEKEVKFTNYIRPICLWAERNDLDIIIGEKGTVVGWGKDEHGVITSAEPKQVILPVVSQEQCIRSHDTFFDITSERTFCAGDRNGSGPCNGDSGGGFIMKRFGQWRLRGLVSMSIADNARNCDLSQYVVFTDVTKFTDWLLSFLR